MVSIRVLTIPSLDGVNLKSVNYPTFRWMLIRVLTIPPLDGVNQSVDYPTFRWCQVLTPLDGVNQSVKLSHLKVDS